MNDEYEKDTSGQSFYAVIPSTVLNDRNLKANAKILYAYISSYTKSSGVCFASNSTLAELMGITPQGVSNLIKNLTDNGHISAEYERKGKQVVRRNITLGVSTNIDRVSTNIIEPINKCYRTYQQITKESIKESNKKSIKDIVYVATEENGHNLDTTCIQNGHIEKPKAKNSRITDKDAEALLSDITEKGYQDSLKLFVVHRREIRKPMTANALKQTIKLLEQIPKVDDRIKCIELSIANGWQGVFPEKFTEAQPARQQKIRTGPEPDLKGDDSWMRKVRNHGKQD